jgi:hypothetical protein
LPIPSRRDLNFLPFSSLRAKLIAVSCACLALVLLVGAGVLLLRDSGSDETGLASLRNELLSLPVQDLSPEEAAGVLYIRESAKASRDLNSNFATLWQSTVFEEALEADQVNMDAADLLLARYNLPLPGSASTPGAYEQEPLLDLYGSLTVEGGESMLAALKASATMQELNILDLQTQMAATDKPAMLAVYGHLVEASARQLWSFARAIERFGGSPYEPSYLTALGFEEVLDSAGQPDDGSLVLRPRPRECGKRYVGEVSRHTPANQIASSGEALRTRVCTSEVDVFGPPVSLWTLAEEQVQVRAYESTEARFAELVDSNSPAFWVDGRLRVINSSGFGSFLSEGENVEQLTNPVPVQLPQPRRPGTVWMEAVWQDPASGLLYGWYHFEPADLDCSPLTAPIIGAAISRDGGLTWEDRGFVIDNGYDYDCAFQNDYFVGGSGDFSVILGPDGEYFYFLFSNYLGTPEEVGVAVARSRRIDLGQPGTVWKLYRGAWNEPGIGGRSSAIFRSMTGWQGPRIDAFWGPSVHWNSFLGKYVALVNRANDQFWGQEGVYLSFSTDLINWTEPEKILESNDWYPQVIGLGQDGSDTVAGRYVRVFVGGLSTFILEFSKSSAR